MPKVHGSLYERRPTAFALNHMSTITDEDQGSGYTENRVQCKRSTTSFNLDDFELVELVAGVRVHLVGHVRRINTQIRSYVHVRGRPVVASPKY